MPFFVVAVIFFGPAFLAAAAFFFDGGGEGAVSFLADADGGISPAPVSLDTKHPMIILAYETITAITEEVDFGFDLVVVFNDALKAYR